MFAGGLSKTHVLAGADPRPQAVGAGAAARVPLLLPVDHIHCLPGRDAYVPNVSFLNEQGFCAV